jgi:hypothetical protein
MIVGVAHVDDPTPVDGYAPRVLEFPVQPPKTTPGRDDLQGWGEFDHAMMIGVGHVQEPEAIARDRRGPRECDILGAAWDPGLRLVAPEAGVSDPDRHEAPSVNQPSGPVVTSSDAKYPASPMPMGIGGWPFTWRSHTASTATPCSGARVSAFTMRAFHGPAAVTGAGMSVLRAARTTLASARAADGKIPRFTSG